MRRYALPSARPESHSTAHGSMIEVGNLTLAGHANAPPTQGVSVRGLQVNHLASGRPIVDEISFEVAPGKLLGIVGESGSGKTTVAMALLGYARPGASIVAGQVAIGGVDIVAQTNTARRRLRGKLTSYVGQDPVGSLNPAKRIGSQMRELLEIHGIPSSAVGSRLAANLAKVALPTDPAFMRRYPHQLSGGQIQRVLLAMALAVEPVLVVLDEPTTSLDVKVQRDVLDLIQTLKVEHSASFVYVAHDLAVVSEIADHVAVMYGGKLVEYAPTSALFKEPQHPYTVRLLGSVPRLTPTRQTLQEIPGTAVGVIDRPTGCPFTPRCAVRLDRCATEMPAITRIRDGGMVRCHNPGAERSRDIVLPEGGPARVATDSHLLRVESLSAGFYIGQHLVPRLIHRSAAVSEHMVVHDVSLSIRANECLGIVGESGSGKTTLARCIVGLHSMHNGKILLDKQPLERSARKRTSNEQRNDPDCFPESQRIPKPTDDGVLDARLRIASNGRDQREKRTEGCRRRAARSRPHALVDLGSIPPRTKRR